MKPSYSPSPRSVGSGHRPPHLSNLRPNQSKCHPLLLVGRPNPNILMTGDHVSQRDHHGSMSPSAAYSAPPPNNIIVYLQTLYQECLVSTELLFCKKITWLLIFGPVSLIGKSGLLGESACFVLAGLALIPLAEVSVKCV